MDLRRLLVGVIADVLWLITAAAKWELGIEIQDYGTAELSRNYLHCISILLLIVIA